MYLKTVDRSAKIAFCPSGPYVACGTLAGAVDTDFSSSSQLEVFSLDLGFSSTVMPLNGQALNAKDRFHALKWGAGADTAAFPRGIIAGGLADGSICLWNPEKLTAGTGEPLTCHLKKHTAAVKGLDINPFQANLFASASGASELCIWDIAKPAMPSLYQTPQNDRATSGEVVELHWNYKVQHILATTSSSGQTVVWDLKREKPVISFSDPSRPRASSFSWHPAIATQLLVASDDDRTPSLQLWDLRNSSSPVREFHGHAKGVLSLAWSLDDPRLLLSSGKDSKTICWDMDAGSTVATLPSDPNWALQVAWSPAARGVFGTATFDGKVAVHNLLSCTSPKVIQEVGADFQPVTRVVGPARPLAVAPKWLGRPCAAAFGFGGRLATTSSAPGAPAGTQAPSLATVSVVASPDSSAAAIAQGLGARVADRSPVALRRLAKVTQHADPTGAWAMIRAQFERDARAYLLRTLGFAAPGDDAATPTAPELHGDGMGFFDEAPGSPAAKAPVDPDAAIGRLLLRGEFEGAVVECLKRGRASDAILVASLGGPELLAATCDEVAEHARHSYVQTVLAAGGSDMTAAIERAPASGWKDALALLCTYAPPEAFQPLAVQLGARLEALGDAASAALVYAAAGDAEDAVRLWADDLPGAAGADELREMVEKAIALAEGSGAASVPTALARRLASMALALASQGRMEQASALLELAPGEDTEDTAALRDRIDRCWDPDMATFSRPFPYAVEDIAPVAAAEEEPVAGPHGGSMGYGYGDAIAGGGMGSGAMGGADAYGGGGGYGAGASGMGTAVGEGYSMGQGYGGSAHGQQAGAPQGGGGLYGAQPAMGASAALQTSPSLSRSSAAPYTHQQSFGSTAGPAVPTPAAAAAASANASQSRTFNRHLYNTAGAYSGSAAPAPASPGTAMPGAGGWGAHVPSPPPAPAPAPGPQMQAGGGGGWGAGAGYGSAAGVQGAMAVPMSGVVGGAPGAGSAYGGAGGAAHGAAPAIMVPGDGSAGQMETTPAARQGPPPGMTLSNIAPGEIGGQGAQVVVALARVLGEVRGMAQQQQLPPMKMKEIDATDQKLGQQLAWQLKQGAVRQEVMQLLGGLLQALQQRNQQGVTHYVSALVKSHFDECPWIPALKRLIKLYGLQ